MKAAGKEWTLDPFEQDKLEGMLIGMVKLEAGCEYGWVCKLILSSPSWYAARVPDPLPDMNAERLSIRI